MQFDKSNNLQSTWALLETQMAMNFAVYNQVAKTSLATSLAVSLVSNSLLALLPVDYGRAVSIFSERMKVNQDL